MSWLDSPACLTVRFEALYTELTEDDPSVVTFPVLHSICDYLDLPRKSPSELAGALGRGLTSSGRIEKVGVYRHRMTLGHFARLRDETFQKLVVECGYERTPPAEKSHWSIRDRAIRKIGERLSLF
jgi:hypothetical protein